MISITEAPKFFTICQSCNHEKKRMWKLEVTTVYDEKSSNGVCVALCTKCLMVMALRAANATKDVGDKDE